MPSEKEFTKYKDRIKVDTLVKDRYYVLEKIGDGCYAKVFLVQDTKESDGSIFALKAIRKVHFKNNKKLPYMLDKEAKIHASLDHPNVVKLHNYFEDKNYVCFLMDYISPGEIYPILYEQDGFSEHEAADYFFQIIQALKYCQSKNVIHRDLKPENLLLTEDGQVKLADFGWATYKKGSSVVGSVHYNAPEMLRYQSYDYKSDIWSMGVILYELLCCEQPFRGKGKSDKEKERATERAIKSGKYKVSKYFNRLSKLAQDLIKKLLVLDPDQRFDYDQILAHQWMKQYAPQYQNNGQVGEKSRKSRSRTQGSERISRERSIERDLERLSDDDESITKIEPHVGIDESDFESDDESDSIE